MPNKFRIIFQPLDTYFFGAENVIPGTDTTNYILKSLAFPRPSTVLGILRYLLLYSNPNLFDGQTITNKIEAAKRIGEKTFDPLSPDFDMGIIHKIGPLHLIRYQPIPSNRFEKTAMFQAGIRTPEIRFNDKLEFIGGYANWKEKDYKSQDSDGLVFGTENGTREYLNAENIFLQRFLTNNHKQKTDREDAFYKTQFRMLAPEYAFCVEMDLLENIQLPETLHLKMGGENRLFRFAIVPSETSVNLSPLLEDFRQTSACLSIAVSDVLLDRLPDSAYRLTRVATARALQSSVQTRSYTTRTRSGGTGVLSTTKRFDLLEAGSAFYFQTRQKQLEFIQQLDEKPGLQQAGWNHFIHFENK